MAQRRVQGDGVELAVLDEGEGRPVLLIHGFPDSSALWRHQVPALTGAGCARSRRTCAGSASPSGRRRWTDYRVGRSVADMVAVLDDAGVERAPVVGHDWGAGVAWALAAFVPDRVERLVAMSVGHPNAYGEQTIESREKAWYMLLFQFEGVAEELLMRDDWALFREWPRDDGDTPRRSSASAPPAC